jgi:transposase
MNYLEHYLLDGRLEISNNRCERMMKSFVIGRKNFLFSFTENGAEASSILYSIVTTAKENNLKVEEYLTYVFDSLSNDQTLKIKDPLPYIDKCLYYFILFM